MFRICSHTPLNTSPLIAMKVNRGVVTLLLMSSASKAKASSISWPIAFHVARYMLEAEVRLAWNAAKSIVIFMLAVDIFYLILFLEVY